MEINIGDTSAMLEVHDRNTGLLGIHSSDWEGFSLAPLGPQLRIDGHDLTPTACVISEVPSPSSQNISYGFGEFLKFDFNIETDDFGVLRIRSTLHNGGDSPLILNHVDILRTFPSDFVVSFGTQADKVRVLEQGAYWGRVVPLVGPSKAPSEETGAEPASPQEQTHHRSELVSVVYDRCARLAFLAGFETSERWMGCITLETAQDGTISSWRLGFDGGDLRIDPGTEVVFETAVFLTGADPWELLKAYGDAVKQRHNPQIPQHPPVSWCSWYPYRLGVSEERVLDIALIANQRLRNLGLTIIEVDLGWEKDNLPCSFEENERFPHGLKWLSGKLSEFGFDLGVWKSPYTISEFDPLAQQHPEWLICDGNGEPVSVWEWFWEPHGKVFILDLTVPEAQGWLRKNIASLRDRGVKYLKMDFIAFMSHEQAKQRHDRTIVCGAGAEASRIGASITSEEFPDALILNCGGPEMPGTGQWPLLYSCSDTGNTGFLSQEFQRSNYQALACHLFKNKRWGIIQPSCLVVGLPGSAEEARLRATAAFLTGGQIDISDDLTTLPEDRWRILTATLPVSQNTAKPIDLFDPIYGPSDYNYSGVCSDETKTDSSVIEHPPGSLWMTHVRTEWDEWELLAIFSFQSAGVGETPSISRYWIPFSKLGIEDGEEIWAYEFWSGQFLGEMSRDRSDPGGYSHPGDYQGLVLGSQRNVLDIGFFGPGVKLLCLRKARKHPWVIGTTFHQSCGSELKNVSWNEETLTLSGVVERPEGESGDLVVFADGRSPLSCTVDGRNTAVRTGSYRTLVIPLITMKCAACWEIRFAESRCSMYHHVR